MNSVSEMSDQNPPLSRKWRVVFVMAFATVLSIFMFYPELFDYSRDNFFTHYQPLPVESDNFKLGNTAKAKGLNATYVSTIPVKRLNAGNVTTVQVKSQNWQNVGLSKNLFVFSAYYLEEENIVQIIGISFVKVKVECTCIFDEKNAIKSTTSIKGEVEILPEHHDKPSGAVFIRCPLRNITKPSSVGIMVEDITTSLQVLYPSPRLYNFTVCIAALHGPYKDPLRIIEMVETDMMFGADYFLVYNVSTTPDVDKVLSYYIKRKKMEVIQWNLPQIDVWYWGQLASMQDCTYASRRQSKYLVLKDIDEFIVPHKHKNWHNLMDELDKKNSKFASYLFLNTFFRLDWGKDKGFQGASAAERFQLRNLLYVWREQYFFPTKVRSKAIVHPERVVTSGIHFPWKVTKGYSDYTVDRTIAYLHHYRTWWGGRPKVKDDFMRQFADKLLLNVNKTLIELGKEGMP